MKTIIKKAILLTTFYSAVITTYGIPLSDTTLVTQSNMPEHKVPVLLIASEKTKKIKWVIVPINDTLINDTLVNAERENDEEEDATKNLSSLEEEYNNHSSNPRVMMRLLRKIKVRKAFRNKRFRARLYTDLAAISARLKMYPLAMQYYYQTIQPAVNDSNATKHMVQDNEDSLCDILLSSTEAATDSLATLRSSSNSTVSSPVKAAAIIASFNDGKEAADYALVLHVKQPSPGKRKAFTGIDNVGHMFITLIKYNTDLSFVSRSFGFYPNKNNILAATPLHPAAPPVLKDDAQHDWDEAIGKFISHKRFNRIIKLLTRFECKMYNLNQNNCTDFGLTIADLSGINITNTMGKWPLGKGNNPANAGQSILEGSITNADAANKNAAELFIFNNVTPFTTVNY